MSMNDSLNTHNDKKSPSILKSKDMSRAIGSFFKSLMKIL